MPELLPESKKYILDHIDEVTIRRWALKHWATLAPDWQDALYRTIRNNGFNASANQKRARTIIQFARYCASSLEEVGSEQLHAYLSLETTTGTGGWELNRTQQQRDDEAGHLREFCECLLRLRGDSDPAETALGWLMEKPLPEIKKKRTKRIRRVVVSAKQIRRALSVLPRLGYPPEEQVVKESYLRGLLTGIWRGANVDAMCWGEDQRRLRLPANGPGKARSELTPTSNQETLLSELRETTPFPKTGDIVYYDSEEAASGRKMKMSSHTKLEMFKRVKRLAGIPASVAFDARAIRHRLITTAWVEGADTPQLRILANHTPDSEVVEDHYIEPLEIWEAEKFTDRILGRSQRHVCENCGLSIVPHQETCPRRNCNEPTRPPRNRPQEACLEDYLNLSESLGDRA